MDNVCDLKLNILSVMHRLIGRALYLEQAIEGLLSAVSQVVPDANAAVMIGGGDEVRFFFTPSRDNSSRGMEQTTRGFYKTGFNLVFRIPQPFVLLMDSVRPLFLDRKALHSIQREQVLMLGSPIILADEVIGAVFVDRFFGDQAPLVEEVELLSMLASFIAQALSLESQVKRREEALVKENMALRAKICEEHLGLVCLGESGPSRRLEAEIRKAAPTDASVLIMGEPGTGKSTIAQIIHELSGRAPFPFVKVHCSLPEDLLEKELFGNGGGFLNGAGDEPHIPRGAFDKAAGGTLLLDEIGDLSAVHQVKLLDIIERLQAGSFGIKRSKWADVRLISISSVDLSEAAAVGTFRRDLLNRLGTLLIDVPSIRERKEDLPLLISHFLAQASGEQGKKAQLNAQVLRTLCEYDWPGNMSELKNTVIRLVIMTEGAQIGAGDLASILDPKHLVTYGPKSVEAISAWSRLDEMERNEVSAALERNKWVRRRAADELGLTFRQMNYRVKKFGLDRLIKDNRSRGRRTS